MNFKKLYLSAEGRVNRKQWWLCYVLPYWLVIIVLALIDSATGMSGPEGGVGPLALLGMLIMLVPAILMCIKRFHDRDKSGWWVLIGLVPIIGGFWFLIELGMLRGTEGQNQFGPPVTA